MSKAKAKQKRPPKKPFPTFPLFPHRSGQWAKKVRGRLIYFGVWDDPDAALEKWLRNKDALLAGQTPRSHTSSVTVDEVVNRFLAAKKMMRDAGELSERSWEDYRTTAAMIVKVLGRQSIAEALEPADFDRLRAHFAKTRGPVATGNHVGRTRTIFRYAAPDQAGLMRHPARFGPSFKRPSKRTLRINRASRPKKLFGVQELRTLIYGTPPQIHAMVLLAINCGLGNADCARLKWRHVDLGRGWLDYSRPKTGIERTAPLWPETVAALHRVAETTERKRSRVPAKFADHIFLTKYGKPWMHAGASSPITQMIRKHLDRLKIYRPGLSFYAIRHTLQTIGDGAKDPAALAHIMGHVDQSMAGHYREVMEPARLVAVSNHVRDWLLPTPKIEAV